MAIYDIFEHVEKCVGQDAQSAEHIHHNSRYTQLSFGREEETLESPESKSRFFSSLAARLFFFMLFVADLAWSVYSVIIFAVSLSLCCLTLFRVPLLRRFHAGRYLSLKRSFVCGVSLLVALFSPALGTMFACTYFLMYDKKGIEEVVPSVLQDQFREFFTHQ